ncbi:hypothetical protein WOLCODRAFT_28397 [Wolfiporia cocos MD-104 SS10]|uniref:Uncharacterized protein n=1 Tax=Wolfiporia cocos (strain MD-104) TaxID=742152 RepID=A0A2H3J2M5_WOLCO|nr:hypothetical protein WOLCODRAFT_28397 [Wolfiporia cocos MD-104 SS10]
MSISRSQLLKHQFSPHLCVNKYSCICPLCCATPFRLVDSLHHECVIPNESLISYEYRHTDQASGYDAMDADWGCEEWAMEKCAYRL